MSDPSSRTDQFEPGPHEYDGDVDDPHWWVELIRDGMFVRGHQIDVTCETCGESSLDDLIDAQAFLWVCECTYDKERVDGSTYETTHTLEIMPSPPARPEEWHIFGAAGVPTDLEHHDDHATVTYEHNGETYEWRLDSETYFEEAKHAE